MIIETVAAAAGGALGALAAYRIAVSRTESRSTALLLVTVLSAFVMGAMTHLGTLAEVSTVGAFATGLFGTAASFAALVRYLGTRERSGRRRALAGAAVIVAAAVGAAMLGYLGTDLAGLAIIKTPRIG